MDAGFARHGCAVEHLLRVPGGGRLLSQRVLGARDLHGGRRMRVLQQLAGNCDTMLYTPLGGLLVPLVFVAGVRRDACRRHKTTDLPWLVEFRRCSSKQYAYVCTKRERARDLRLSL